MTWAVLADVVPDETAPGVAILGGMRPASERRAAVGSMVRVDGGGRGRRRGGERSAEGEARVVEES